jgi:ribosome-associated protein
MDIRKLQRVIVDALEDVKAQDIRAFNSTGLTDLFDRVVIATGTSNRHTRALANSVREKVKTAGGEVLGMEGEEGGEWVLVDLGDALVHIMQPAIRAYYNLEEIWGDKPVALRSTAPAPASRRTATPDANDGNTTKPTARKVARKPATTRKAAAKKTPAAKKRPLKQRST